jgi:transcriptional regulator with XRE-family HTH domain
MHERIKSLRRDLKMTQQEFADRLHIKRGAVANYEVGRNVPADSVIALICKEFGVSEMWLRTGEGKPYPERGRLEELSYMTGRFLSSEPTEFQRRFAMMMFSLTDEEWKLLEQKARALLEELPEP